MPCTTKSNGNIYSLKPEEQNNGYIAAVMTEHEVGHNGDHNGYGYKNGNMYKWGWKKMGKFLFWLIILTVILWLIYFSLSPAFVTKSDSDEVDTSKVLLWAFVTALIILLVFAIICYMMGW